MTSEIGSNDPIGSFGDAPDHLPDYQFLVVAARTTWLAAHPGVAARLLRALQRGREDVYANRALAIDLAIGNMRSSAEHAAATWEFFDKHRPHHPNLEIKPDAFQNVLDTMAEARTLDPKRAKTPARYLDLSHLGAARGRGNP